MTELAKAPIEIQLAVDLILLLEQQPIAPDTVLKALEIVKKDFQKKINQPSAE